MNYNTEDIELFISACDNMINSKFILVDKRIADVLKAIAQTKPVYNVIAESMINFNFANEWKYATSRNGDFLFPEESHKAIALVFCMLKNIDDNKININELLVKHFSNDDNKRSSYVIFCEKTILTFKNAIVDRLCNISNSNTKQETLKPNAKEVETTNPNMVAIEERLEFLLRDLNAYVIGIKKLKSQVAKQDYRRVIEGFRLALQNKHYIYYELFGSLLANLANKDKEICRRITEINDLVRSATKHDR